MSKGTQVSIALDEINSHVDETRRISSVRGPTAALQIIYRNLDFSVDAKNSKNVMETKPILKNLTGTFRPGKFTAIMGASGAGKTSLLNVVAGTARGNLSGEILVNGQAANASTMRKISGYVHQDDLILATMTVREAITMSAMLRLPKTMSNQAKLDVVEDTIELCHLTRCVDTVIGDQTIKGVSGGERKRTAVAMELLTNPPILFLDEPTSGLDSFTAFSIIQTLSNLAKSGRTIVATLHQPSSEIFHMFDDLLILADGKTLFYGPAPTTVDYFAKIGYKCPTFTNPADYIFMSVLNDAVRLNTLHNTLANGENRRPSYTNAVELEATASTSASTSSSSSPSSAMTTTTDAVTNEERIPKLLSLWDKSPEAAEILKSTEVTQSGGIKESDIKAKADFSTQFALLGRRALKNALRNKLIVQGKLGQTLFNALVIGLIYLNINKDQSSVQNRTGALFFVAVNNIFASTMSVLSIFAGEKAVFQREYGSRMYGLPAYFISKCLVEMPFNVVFPFIGVCIYYFMIGFQDDVGKFFIHVIAVILLFNTGSALGIFLGCLFNDLAVALAIVPLILLPLMIFSGLFINLNDTPYIFYWIPYISPMKYAFSAVIQNEMDGLEFNCYLNGTFTVGAGCPVPNGEVQVENLSLGGLSIGANIVIVFAFMVVFLLLAYLALWMGIRSPKKGPAKK